MEDGLVLADNEKAKNLAKDVLILVVVEDGLVLHYCGYVLNRSNVLILVVVEDGLVPMVAPLMLFLAKIKS